MPQCVFGPCISCISHITITKSSSCQARGSATWLSHGARRLLLFAGVKLQNASTSSSYRSMQGCKRKHLYAQHSAAAAEEYQSSWRLQAFFFTSNAASLAHCTAVPAFRTPIGPVAAATAAAPAAAGSCCLLAAASEVLCAAVLTAAVASAAAASVTVGGTAASI